MWPCPLEHNVAPPPHLDLKTGKASFDGRGHISKPSQGALEGEISTASDLFESLMQS